MNSSSPGSVVGRDVAVRRGGREVFAGLNFCIGAGEALVLRGPNGAGKTTLLRAVAGLVSLACGQIEVSCGREGLHFVGHLNAIKAQLTVLANARFWAAWQGRPGGEVDAEERAMDALDAVGLGALYDTPTQYLSQGQRRRLALARLVASKRPVWLLDEPVSGLDAASRDMFAGLMQGHLAKGGAIIAATHEPLGLSAPKELVL